MDYRKAARVDDALLVRTSYDAVQGARLLVSQRITRGEDLIAEASLQAVCIDMAGRAKRPPRDLVEKLRPYFAP